MTKPRPGFPGGRGRKPDHHGGDDHAGGLPRGTPGRGGRLGRWFAHGDLHLLVLSLIAEQPRHGYEIIKQIEVMTAGEYSPSPGTIYPALTMLDDQGFVAAAPDERGKKVFSMTQAGLDYLCAHDEVVRAMVAAILGASGQRPAHPAPGDHIDPDHVDPDHMEPEILIRRAMGALRSAIRHRLEDASVTAETGARIITILHRAAQDISKL